MKEAQLGAVRSARRGQVWSTRLKLATALFEYLEVFDIRQRRHSSIGMLTPIEFEARQGAPATSTVA